MKLFCVRKTPASIALWRSWLLLALFAGLGSIGWAAQLPDPTNEERESVVKNLLPIFSTDPKYRMDEKVLRQYIFDYKPAGSPPLPLNKVPPQYHQIAWDILRTERNYYYHRVSSGEGWSNFHSNQLHQATNTISGLLTERSRFLAETNRLFVENMELRNNPPKVPPGTAPNLDSTYQTEIKRQVLKAITDAKQEANTADVSAAKTAIADVVKTGSKDLGGKVAIDESVATAIKKAVEKLAPDNRNFSTQETGSSTQAVQALNDASQQLQKTSTSVTKVQGDITAMRTESKERQETLVKALKAVKDAIPEKGDASGGGSRGFSLMSGAIPLLLVSLLLGAIGIHFHFLSAKVEEVKAEARSDYEKVATSIQQNMDFIPEAVTLAMGNSVQESVKKSVGGSVKEAEKLVTGAVRVLQDMERTLNDASQRVASAEEARTRIVQLAVDKASALETLSAAKSDALETLSAAKSSEVVLKIDRKANELKDLMEQIKGLTNEQQLKEVAAKSGSVARQLSELGGLCAQIQTDVKRFNEGLSQAVADKERDVNAVGKRLAELDERATAACGSLEKAITGLTQTFNVSAEKTRTGAEQALKRIEDEQALKRIEDEQALKRIKDDSALADQRLWPEPFRQGKPLGASREELRCRVKEGDEDAGNLQIELYLLQRLLRRDSVDMGELAAALDRVGLLAYSFWRGMPGSTVAATYERSHEWETELNAALKAKNLALRISAIIPNTPFNLATMLADQSTTGANFRVKEPLSWTVIGTAQGREKVVFNGRVISE